MNSLERNYDSKEIIAGLIMKLISVEASVYGLIRTMDSLLSFTYFTNLSNIFLDFVLLIFIYFDIELLLSKGKREHRCNPAYITKYVATISITLTFLVYLTLLAPTNANGFIYAYLNNGAGSLCVHMVGPVLAIIDFLLFDYGYVSSKNMHCSQQFLRWPMLSLLLFYQAAVYVGEQNMRRIIL